HVPESAQTLAKRLPFRAVGGAENADPPDLPRRLRLGGERHEEEQRSRASEELATVHYWITSSARASTDCGIVRPSALVVLRLITSSNFVGCSMGRSPGLAPFRILSTKYAARRLMSSKFSP